MCKTYVCKNDSMQGCIAVYEVDSREEALEFIENQYSKELKFLEENDAEIEYQSNTGIEAKICYNDGMVLNWKICIPAKVYPKSFEVSDKEIKRILKEEGCTFTDKIDEAIFILRDGAMIAGDFVDGIRGLDHRIIENCMKDANRYDSDFWSKVHAFLGVVQVVPETKKILVMEGQAMTNEQLKILFKDGKKYKVETAFQEICTY